MANNYYTYYLSIFCNLQFAYMDYFALKQIEEGKKNSSAQIVSDPLSKRVSDIQMHFRKQSLDHLVIVLQDDLCLSLCKMYVDEGKDTKTIKQLRSFVRKNGKQPVKKFSPEFQNGASFIRDLKTYRDCCIAHDISLDNVPIISLDKAWALLEEIRAALNEMYYDDLSSNPMPFNDDFLERIKAQEQIGIRMMMSLPKVDTM